MCERRLNPRPGICLIHPVPVPLRLSAIVVSLALAPLAAAAPAPVPVEPAAPTPAVSWTAQILHPVAARQAPRDDAKVAGRLTTYTAFWRRAQQLMVLAPVQTDPATGRRWVLVRLPGRPNLAQGFVPEDAVRLRATRTRIVVRVGARKVEVWKAGRRVGRYTAAVGTGSTPTPTGLFAVQDPVPSAPSQRSYLGPYIITLTAYSNVLQSFMGGNGLVAIHGTNATGQLGQAVSHGCVRINNAAVTRLYRMTAPGTPVEIVPLEPARLEQAAQELLGLGRSGSWKIRSGSPRSSDAALVEEADLVGDLAGEAHLVGGDHHRHPLRLEVADRREHLADQLGVEGAGDLVEQQRPRPGGEGAGDRDPLLLAAGEVVGAVVLAAREAEAREQLARRAPRPRRAATPCARIGAEHDVLEHGQVREQVVGLEDEPEPAADRDRVDRGVGDHLAVEEDVAVVDLLEQVDAAQQRRLARARGADQRDRLVLADRRGRCRAGPRARRTPW